MIRLQHKGICYQADTPEEAAALGALFRTNGVVRPVTFSGWSQPMLSLFIDKLGEAQQSILTHLVSVGCATDDDLRAVIGVHNNQALSGVISGISKQAIALGISPRSVFSFRNRRSGRKRSSSYQVAEDFQRVSLEGE